MHSHFDMPLSFVMFSYIFVEKLARGNNNLQTKHLPDCNLFQCTITLILARNLDNLYRLILSQEPNYFRVKISSA